MISDIGLTLKVVHTTAEVSSLSYTSIVKVFLYSENCPYTCRGLQFEVWLRKLSIQLQRSAVWATHPLSPFFSTPKTVHTPAEVCSFVLKLENVAATPKTVHTPADVCSLRNCPYTCSPLQFEPQFLLWLKLQRSAGVWTISQTAIYGRGSQVIVGSKPVY